MCRRRRSWEVRKTTRDAQHAAYWREVAAKMQEATARTAGAAGRDTADVLRILEDVMSDEPQDSASADLQDLAFEDRHGQDI